MRMRPLRHSALRNALQTASESAFRTERISGSLRKRDFGWMKERKGSPFPSVDGRKKRMGRKQLRMKKAVPGMNSIMAREMKRRGPEETVMEAPPLE